MKFYLISADWRAITECAIIVIVKAANQDQGFRVWFPVFVLILHINFKSMFSQCAFLYLKCGYIIGGASEVLGCQLLM